MFQAWKNFLATRKKMSKTPRIRIPPEVKKYLFQRDKYQCQSCGKTTIETNLSIDHIISCPAKDLSLKPQGAGGREQGERGF